MNAETSSPPQVPSSPASNLSLTAPIGFGLLSWAAICLGFLGLHVLMQERPQFVGQPLRASRATLIQESPRIVTRKASDDISVFRWAQPDLSDINFNMQGRRDYRGLKTISDMSGQFTARYVLTNAAELPLFALLKCPPPRAEGHDGQALLAGGLKLGSSIAGMQENAKDAWFWSGTIPARESASIEIDYQVAALKGVTYRVVEHILFKALAKQPDDRYPDMNALISAMDGVLTENQKFEAPLSTITAKKKAKPSPKVVRAVTWTLAIGLIIVFGTPWIKQQFSWTSETTSTAKFIAPATSTITIIPPTKTLGASPSPILTEKALPTTINTPAPSWVTDFAEPIIAAIKDRGPDFLDDFSIDTHQWHVYINWGNTQYPLIIDKGVMSIYQSSVSNFYFLHKPNIVFQVDALAPISDAQTVTLASNFFDQPDPLKLQLDPLNQWSVRLHVENEIAKGSYQSGGEKTQLIVLLILESTPSIEF